VLEERFNSVSVGQMGEEIERAKPGKLLSPQRYPPAKVARSREPTWGLVGGFSALGANDAMEQNQSQSSACLKTIKKAHRTSR